MSIFSNSCSSTNSEISVENEVRRSRNRNETQFSTFVDKAMADVPISVANNRARRNVQSSNPLDVLKSYNLLGSPQVNIRRDDADSATEITFYSSEKGPGYVKEYETTSHYKGGELVSSRTRKTEPRSSEESLCQSFSDMNMKPSFLEMQRGTSGAGKPRFYRKLKTIAEMREECERRRIIERRNAAMGRNQKLSPISKWKYIEIPPTEKKVLSNSDSSLNSTYLITDPRKLPYIEEKNNMDEELRRQKLMERIIIEHSPYQKTQNLELADDKSIYELEAMKNREQPYGSPRSLRLKNKIKRQIGSYESDDNYEDASDKFSVFSARSQKEKSTPQSPLEGEKDLTKQPETWATDEEELERSPSTSHSQPEESKERMKRPFRKTQCGPIRSIYDFSRIRCHDSKEMGDNAGDGVPEHSSHDNVIRCSSDLW